MAEILTADLQVQKSLKFFLNTENYSPISSTSDGKRIIDCIHPTDKEIALFANQPVTVQTAGGKLGIGHDMAISVDAVHNTGAHTAAQGATLHTDLSSDIVAYPHHGCLFAKEYATVLEEEVSPSDFTLASLERWSRIHRFAPSDTIKRRINDSMKRHLEHTLSASPSQNPEDFMDPDWDHLDLAHTSVMDTNRSRVYTVNHMLRLGLDRGAKRRAGVQGYHDNPGALLEHYGYFGANGLEKEALALIGLTRAAATRSVIGRGHPDMHFLEVSRGKDGLAIKKVESLN